MKTLITTLLITLSLSAHANSWTLIDSNYVGSGEWACTYESIYNSKVQMTTIQRGHCSFRPNR